MSNTPTIEPTLALSHRIVRESAACYGMRLAKREGVTLSGLSDGDMVEVGDLAGMRLVGPVWRDIVGAAVADAFHAMRSLPLALREASYDEARGLLNAGSVSGEAVRAWFKLWVVGKCDYGVREGRPCLRMTGRDGADIWVPIGWIECA